MRRQDVPNDDGDDKHARERGSQPMMKAKGSMFVFTDCGGFERILSAHTTIIIHYFDLIESNDSLESERPEGSESRGGFVLSSLFSIFDSFSTSHFSHYHFFHDRKCFNNFLRIYPFLLFSLSIFIYPFLLFSFSLILSLSLFIRS